MSVGTIIVALEVEQKQTGVEGVPDYFEVGGARVVSTTLSTQQIGQLIEDNVNDGILGFENGSLDEAIESYRDNEPEDPRIPVLESMLRMNLAPQMKPGAFHADAVAWLQKLDSVKG